MNDPLRPMIMAEHFCEENNCSLCMSAIHAAQSQVVEAKKALLALADEIDAAADSPDKIDFGDWTRRLKEIGNP